MVWFSLEIDYNYAVGFDARGAYRFPPSAIDFHAFQCSEKAPQILYGDVRVQRGYVNEVATDALSGDERGGCTALPSEKE